MSLSLSHVTRIVWIELPPPFGVPRPPLHRRRCRLAKESTPCPFLFFIFLQRRVERERGCSYGVSLEGERHTRYRRRAPAAIVMRPPHVCAHHRRPALARRMATPPIHAPCPPIAAPHPPARRCSSPTGRRRASAPAGCLSRSVRCLPPQPL